MLAYSSPPQAGFTVLTTQDRQVHVTLAGELDVVTAADLARRLSGLIGLRPQRITFDLSGLTFLGCETARLLGRVSAYLPPGRKPEVVGAKPVVRRMLELTGQAGRLELRD